MSHPAFRPIGDDPLAQAVRRALGLATAGAFVLVSPALLAQEAGSTEKLETETVEAQALSVITEGTARYRVPLTSTATRLHRDPGADRRRQPRHHQRRAGEHSRGHR